MTIRPLSSQRPPDANSGQRQTVTTEPRRQSARAETNDDQFTVTRHPAGGDRVSTVTTRTSTRNLTRRDNEKTDLADEQHKPVPPREAVNDTAGQRAQKVGRVDIFGVKQRNARTNPETSDTGQTRPKTHLSTLEPITVNARDRANVNYDTRSAGDNQIDATDDSSAGDSESRETKTDIKHGTDRSSKRERNSDKNVCMLNTESDCDNMMCCENFKKLTGACLRIMIEMLAKASVDLNSDVGLQSTAKKKV